MTLRFLAGVALFAGGATYLVKRYRKKLEIEGEAEAGPRLDADSSTSARARGDGASDPGEAIYVS